MSRGSCHFSEDLQQIVKTKKTELLFAALFLRLLQTGGRAAVIMPEVANLVFFKPVYSKIKFWQMIGRGTRLCPDLFGPEDDKQDFRIFDFCFNFDFFRQNPTGIEGSVVTPIGARLFRSRVTLLGYLQEQAPLALRARLRTPSPIPSTGKSRR